MGNIPRAWSVSAEQTPSFAVGRGPMSTEIVTPVASAHHFSYHHSLVNLEGISITCCPKWVGLRKRHILRLKELKRWWSFYIVLQLPTITRGGTLEYRQRIGRSYWIDRVCTMINQLLFIPLSKESPFRALNNQSPLLPIIPSTTTCRRWSCSARIGTIKMTGLIVHMLAK